MLVRLVVLRDSYSFSCTRTISIMLVFLWEDDEWGCKIMLVLFWKGYA